MCWFSRYIENSKWRGRAIKYIPEILIDRRSSKDSCTTRQSHQNNYKNLLPTIDPNLSTGQKLKEGEGWCKWGEGHYFSCNPKGEDY